MRLLLVEDHADLRRLFARVLRGQGFDVCEAADAEGALDCLQEFTPDVVVTDLMMPGVDGLELTRRIRATPGLRDVPVVVMSAWADARAVENARRVGAADVLAKPVDAPTLLGCLAAFRR
jgi:CheY-like chemotaxis protein